MRAFFVVWPTFPSSPRKKYRPGPRARTHEARHPSSNRMKPLIEPIDRHPILIRVRPCGCTWLMRSRMSRSSRALSTSSTSCCGRRIRTARSTSQSKPTVRPVRRITMLAFPKSSSTVDCQFASPDVDTRGASFRKGFPGPADGDERSELRQHLREVLLLGEASLDTGAPLVVLERAKVEHGRPVAGLDRLRGHGPQLPTARLERMPGAEPVCRPHRDQKHEETCRRDVEPLVREKVTGECHQGGQPAHDSPERGSSIQPGERRIRVGGRRSRRHSFARLGVVCCHVGLTYRVTFRLDVGVASAPFGRRQ